MPSGRPAKDRELCGYLLAGFTRAICVLPVALSIFPIMLRLAEEGARRSRLLRTATMDHSDNSGERWYLLGPPPSWVVRASLCGARPIPHPRSLRRARTALLPDPPLPCLS
jgi:hypothetical protein